MTALLSSVEDSLLISSFLRYVDEFEQDALKSVMNGDINANIDEEVYNNVVAILSRCQSVQFPTRKNICQLVALYAVCANIKVDFKAGFTRTPLANTCSSHLHLSTSYMTLNEFKTNV